MSGNSEAGHTLVELLVSLALLAAIGALSAAGLQSTARIGAVTQRETREAEVHAAREATRRILASSRWLVVSKAGADPAAVFYGEPNSILVVTTAEPHLERNGLVETRFKLNEAGQFIVARKAWRSSSTYELVLLDGVESLAFSYFGKAGDLDTQEWHAEWQGQAEIPMAVRVEIGLSNEGQVGWTPLIVDIAAAR